MMIVAPRSCQYSIQDAYWSQHTNGSGSNEQVLSRLGDGAIVLGSRRRWWQGDNDGLGRVTVGKGGCRRLWFKPTESHRNEKLLRLVHFVHWRGFFTSGALDGIVSEGVVIAVMVGFSA
jgi:hypothetical protein